MNHFEFIQPPKSNACDLNLDQRLFLSVNPASFNHLFVCLHTADARTNRSKRCCLRGGQSSKGSGEVQGRKRTSDLTHWGRGGGRRFALSLPLYCCLTFGLLFFFLQFQQTATVFRLLLSAVLQGCRNHKQQYWLLEFNHSYTWPSFGRRI